jgi:mRNA-degrading endonuclease RelE of RelBE toxin-antitoxin system
VSYEIELSRRAEKEILKLDAAMFGRIGAAIDGLSENPDTKE